MECKDKRNAFNRAIRRYRDNKCEENLNQMRLAGKDYKVIINKAKAAEKHTFIQTHQAYAQKSLTICYLRHANRCLYAILKQTRRIFRDYKKSFSQHYWTISI